MIDVAMAREEYEKSLAQVKAAQPPMANPFPGQKVQKKILYDSNNPGFGG
jgi:hypothetical protein